MDNPSQPAPFYCNSWFLIPAVFLIYLFSPISQIGDARYTMLLSENLCRNGEFQLDAYFHGANAALPYQLQMSGGHVYYLYPPGAPILSTPFVAVANLCGLKVINSHDDYNRLNEWILHKVIAAFLASAFVALLFRLAKLTLPPLPSLLVAVSIGLGSRLWSTASRAVWSQTWGILLVLGAIYLLVRSEAKGRDFSPVILATLLSWAFFCRPTFWLPAAAIAFYTLYKYPHKFLGLSIVGSLWLAIFVLWSFITFGKCLPPYFLQAGMLNLQNFFQAVAAHLLSPSRGLFTFTPWLAMLLWFILKYRRRIPYKGFAVLSLAVIGVHLVLVSTWPCWWFGHSFGPRAFVDTLPWWGLLAVLCAKPLSDDLKSTMPAISSVARRNLKILCFLVVLSVIIHGAGAISYRSHLWNYYPRDVDDCPQRVWDWKDPQLAAFLIPQNEKVERARGGL